MKKVNPDVPLGYLHGNKFESQNKLRKLENYSLKNAPSPTLFHE